MRRRDFIEIVAGSVAAWPLATRAQQQTMPVIGALYGVSASSWAPRMAEFRDGLGRTGFTEGQNVIIDYRWAEGHFERLPAMASDLVARKVSVIVAGGIAPVRAAMAATTTIPIVFTVGVDPAATGLVDGLSHPGRNATGATMFTSELVSKRVELLSLLLPAAHQIAVLVNPNDPEISQRDIEDTQRAARQLGLEIIPLSAGSETEINEAFAAAVQKQAAAILIGSDAYFLSRSKQIATLSLQHSMPTIGYERAAAAAGQLVSYGPVLQGGMYYSIGIYVGRILKGEKPRDLPVLQPTKFELVINNKTANSLGINISGNVLSLADEVIE